MNRFEREAVERLVQNHKREYQKLKYECEEEYKKYGGFIR